jgi:hypothetical protein
MLTAAFLLGVTALFFHPIFVGRTLSDVEARQAQTFPWAGTVERRNANAPLHFDQADSFYPWQVFMTRALDEREVPLWNPYSFGGVPFLANATNGFLYPPRLLLTEFVAPFRAHDLLLLSHMFFAGIAMYLLLRHWHVRAPAAAVGALAWMLNSFMLGWMALEHYVVIAALLPIAFLLIDWARAGRCLPQSDSAWCSR